MHKSLAKTPQQPFVRIRRHQEGSRSHPSIHPILKLQQSIGNKAVLELLRSVHVQPKLAVSEPSDTYEQEAERIAEAVISSKPAARNSANSSSMGLANSPEQQRSAGAYQSTDGTRLPADLVKYLGTSQPLAASTRELMEPCFGQDFGGVRVHAQAKAGGLARWLGAEAFTFGNSIAFADGRYAPDTHEGRRLLAHELAHVAQQRCPGGAARGVFEPGRIENAARVTESPKIVRADCRPAQPQISRKRASGLEMWQERTDADAETQRREAFRIIEVNRSLILSEAKNQNIAAEAIAGAIFWEALENPYASYRAVSTRLGPGKIHPGPGSEAEKAEQAGLIKTREHGGQVPKLPDTWEERARSLHDEKVAISYIAAIMRRHADDYLKIAKVDITHNVGVLCTLYQGGHSEERAAKLAERRKTDPKAQPQAGDEMGPWVENNLETIRGWISPPPRPH